MSAKISQQLKSVGSVLVLLFAYVAIAGCQGGTYGAPVAKQPVHFPSLPGKPGDVPIVIAGGSIHADADPVYQTPDWTSVSGNPYTTISNVISKIIIVDKDAAGIQRASVPTNGNAWSMTLSDQATGGETVIIASIPPANTSVQ